MVLCTLSTAVKRTDVNTSKRYIESAAYSMIELAFNCTVMRLFRLFKQHCLCNRRCSMTKLPGNGAAAAVTDERRRRNSISIINAISGAVAVSVGDGRQTA